MKFIKYGKYVADPFDGLSAEDLMQLLQDYLLDSGFYNQFYDFQEMNEKTMEQLHEALLEAMRNQGMIPQELLDQLLKNSKTAEGADLNELINKLLERLAEEGYISIEQPNPKQVERAEARPGQVSGRD